MGFCPETALPGSQAGGPYMQNLCLSQKHGISSDYRIPGTHPAHMPGTSLKNRRKAGLWINILLFRIKK